MRRRDEAFAAMQEALRWGIAMHLLFGTYSVYRETRVIYAYSVMAIT